MARTLGSLTIVVKVQLPLLTVIKLRILGMKITEITQFKEFLEAEVKGEKNEC